LSVCLHNDALGTPAAKRVAYNGTRAAGGFTLFGIGPIELVIVGAIAVTLCAAPVVLIVMLMFAFARRGERGDDQS